MRRLGPALLLLLPMLAAGSVPARTEAGPMSEVPRDGEVLTFHWALKGFVGTLARIFVPGSGEGLIVNRPVGEGRFESEFRITSKSAAKREFWSYGSVIDRSSLRPLEAWNVSHYRGRDRRREIEIEEPGLIDIPTAIHLLRTAPPETPLRLRLWADGKIYPVLFESHGLQYLRMEGRQVLVAAHSVVGLDEPGERTWEGRLDLWTTPDERALPVEILFRREGAKVLLTLVSPDPLG